MTTQTATSPNPQIQKLSTRVLRGVSLAALLVLAAGLVAVASPVEASAQTAGDADGDRIPDNEEMDSRALLVNADFEDVNPALADAVWGSAPRRAMQFDASEIPGWGTTENTNRIEVWEAGYANVPSQSGKHHAEINANDNAILWQDLSTTPGSTLEWSIWHRGRAGVDTASAGIGNADGGWGAIEVVTKMVTANTAWVRYEGVYEVPAGQTRTRLAFIANETAAGNLSVGNFIDNLEVNVLIPRDTDGDGTPDHEDTDSNNDGTPDGAGNYDIEDSGLGEGASCGATVDADRLPRQVVTANDYTTATRIFSTSFTGPIDYVVLSGSWEQSGGDLRQVRECGYDYTALLKTAQVANFRFEASLRALDGINQGGLVFNQSSEDTRSGAMIVDLANAGTVLRWGQYDDAGYYTFIGSVPVASQGTDTIGVTQQNGAIDIAFNGVIVGQTTTDRPGGHVGLVSTLSAVAFEQATLTALPANTL